MGKIKSFWLAILLFVFLSTSYAAGIERKDAVKDQSSTTGTGAWTITGIAPNGARTITSAHTTGSTVRYRAVNSDGSQWEDGEGVWTSATNTLTRVTVFASSNSGSLVNFTTSPISVLTVPTAKDFDVPDWAKSSDIASASTVNLDAATGGIVHITGTTTITGVTLTRGPRLVIFDGALTLTHNATTNSLPGATNIPTAAGDRAWYIGDGTTVYVANYIRAANAPGYINIPQNSQSAAYTTVLADAGTQILHPSTDANARTFTIDSNANVAYPIGTAITFINMTAQAVTVAITTDTMYLAGSGTTGSRTLSQYGVATAVKIDSTHWIISGPGLT